jgi:hypothetical protein
MIAFKYTTMQLPVMGGGLKSNVHAQLLHRLGANSALCSSGSKQMQQQHVSRKSLTIKYVSRANGYQRQTLVETHDLAWPYAMPVPGGLHH